MAVDRFLQRGLEWAQAQRKKHMSIDVRIGTTFGTASELRAVVSQNETKSNPKNLTRERKVFTFVFDRDELVAEGITISRDLSIWIDTDQYQVMMDGDVKIDTNDPLRNEIILTATLK